MASAAATTAALAACTNPLAPAAVPSVEMVGEAQMESGYNGSVGMTSENTTTTPTN